MNGFSSPSKIILLGEYAVLTGQPAVVAAIAPRFEMRATSAGAGELPFAEQSPAGRLIADSEKKFACEFRDPFRGAGGFGASTAQYALVHRTLFPKEDWKAAWSRYREMNRAEEPILTPSGADLVAQWRGGVQLFQIEGESATAEDISKGFDFSSVLVFSATGQDGRKTATHEHLRKLSGEHLQAAACELRQPLQSGVQAIRRGDVRGLGAAMTGFAETLRRLKLESDRAHEDRVALNQIPGVFGVKGAGAMQTDAVIVVIDPSNSTVADAVIAAADARGLRLVCNGIRPEAGVTPCA